MTLAVRWTKHAADQLIASAQYLEDARSGSGLTFIDAVEESLRQAAQAPYSNPRIPDEPETTRKALLSRFGYWVIYEVSKEAIVVLAVWHAIREPGSWRDGSP